MAFPRRSADDSALVQQCAESSVVVHAVIEGHTHRNTAGESSSERSR
jgi:hypothetical protein